MIGVKIIVEKLYDNLDAMDRLIILGAAGTLLGTLYRWGCKGSGTSYGGRACESGHLYEIDCSGLVSYAYSIAGLKSMGSPEDPMNARSQQAASISTLDPLYADLVFFHGTQDTDDDCDRDEVDEASHVGIFLHSVVNEGQKTGFMIDAAEPANGLHGLHGVDVRLFDEIEQIPKRYVTAADPEYNKCKDVMKDQYQDLFDTGYCPGSGVCYKWVRKGTMIKFNGYGVAPEFINIC